MEMDETVSAPKDADTGSSPLVEPFYVRSRSVSERYFSKMQFGSFRGSIFTLAATSFTPAIMVMPYIFSQSGVILSTFILLFTGILTIWGQYTIAEFFELYGVFNYSRLGECVTGKRWIYYVMEFWVVLYELGVIIGNQILLASFLLELFYAMGAGFEHEEILLLFILNILVINPLSLIRSVSGFRFAALAAIGSILYLCLLVFVEMPLYAKESGEGGVVYGAANLALPTTFNLGMFSYFCHPNVGSIQHELSQTSAPRMKVVIFRAILSNILINVLLGVFGYLSTLSDTPPDWAMLIGKLFYMVVLVLSCVLNLHPWKTSILEVLKKRESILANRLVTIGIVWFSFLIAVVYPNILGVLAIVGGISVVGLALVMPAVLTWSRKDLAQWRKVGVVLGTAMLSCVSVMSLVVTIIFI